MSYYSISNIDDKDIYFDFNKMRFTIGKIDNTEKRKKTDYVMEYPKRLNKLILLNSNKCNLSCSYCIADGGVYTLNHDKELASIYDFKSNIEYIYNSYPDGIQYIQFFGGEPLCNKLFIKEIVDYLEVFCNERGIKRPVYSIVTNGTLIDDKTISYFKETNMRVTISLDGTQEVHDNYRKTKDGQGTYERIVCNIKKMNGISKTVELSVTEELVRNYHEDMVSNIINEYIENGINGIILNIIFTDEMNQYFMNCSNYKRFCNDYINIMIEYLFSKDCKIFDYSLTNTIIAILTKKKMRNTCTAGVGNLTINTNGQILRCYLNKDIKWIDNSPFDKRRERVVEIILPEKCDNCSIYGLCSGWCSEINSGDIVSSKCLYTNILVDTCLTKVYTSRINKESMNACIRNIERFQAMV